MEMERIEAVRNQLANQYCFVDLSANVRENDFVFVKDENNSPRIARVEQVFGHKAHVICYRSATDLPRDVKLVSDTGLKINFHSQELIEDVLESKNIDLSLICGKCMVFKAHENDSIADILQRNRKLHPMAYVCRYKLVKETIYKLVPVSWQPGEEEEAERNSGEMTDMECYTDTEDQASEAMPSLNESLDKIIEQLNSTSVEPKKSVQKATRTQNQTSPNKRASPDAGKDNEEVSPSKRNKLTGNSNYGTPGTRNGKYESPAQKQMSKIKKNLNDSFTEALQDHPSSPYETTMNPKEPLKLTFSKGNKKPLTEKNENTMQSPMNKTLISIRGSSKRRSILKNLDSPKSSTPRRSIAFVELPKSENKRNNDVESTPSRRSTRMSSAAANAAMQAHAVQEESSPEVEKKRSGKSTTKPMSPPSTPKSASKRSTAAKRQRTPKTPKTPKGTMTPQQTRSLYRSGGLTPSIQSRQESIGGEQTELEQIRERLQVSAVPASLPCREKEYASIYEFIMGKLSDGSGGCIYISGVPGTGKTATVTQVIKTIQKESKPKKLPAFDCVDINGMRLTEPRQAYVQIYRQLTGKTMAWAQARDLLESRFTAGAKKAIRPTVLLVDELDIICNRKQDVVYNLFDWTVRKGSRLIAITIANTMDLPERVLKLKVASRLGLTRITFQPYSFKQLQEVVMTRLAGSNCFMADAVQLVARKVASVSGDCRRALDICRRATEIAEEKSTGAGLIEVNFAHINQALSEMFASPKVRAIKNCTKFEKLFLQAVASEIQRTGIEEVEFHRVFWQIGTLAPILGIKNPPTEDQAMMICMSLAANRLLIAEDSSAGLYQKIILNATVDDLYYALNVS
ncbi:origin recognition complex subunit 1 isoform X3 [Sitodiplosis mosellana]|uniref:origin recognition complex subunit 1 isoform X3 n=1 Tax=Sitodiplosis mosellana TaxID=263140 RepID=UPI002443E5D0|nr:origin recognition complex subunit 1 isoform X3 [Sitodiplosis mosellana]